MFNINTFKAMIDQGGLAKTTQYSVLVTPPPSAGSVQAGQDLMYRADSVGKPGRSIQTVDDSYHYGPVVRKAYGVSFEEVPVQFILSKDWSEKIFFEQWQDKMVGSGRDGAMTTSMYDVGYFNDYIGTVTITCYDDTGAAVYELKLIEAFPVAISQVQMSWEGGDQLAKLIVNFAYTRYEDKKLNSTFAADDGSGYYFNGPLIP